MSVHEPRCARMRCRRTTGCRILRGTTMTQSSDSLIEALKQLRLYGCLARVEEIRHEPWLERVMAIEREERTRRSLVHRNHLAGVGTFKPLCDFDWAWPKS